MVDMTRCVQQHTGCYSDCTAVFRNTGLVCKQQAHINLAVKQAFGLTVCQQELIHRWFPAKADDLHKRGVIMRFARVTDLCKCHRVIDLVFKTKVIT